MMVYDMGRQYHAERVMGATERRQADEQAGRLAAAAAQAWQRYLGSPGRVLRVSPGRVLRALRMPGVTIGG